MLTGSIVSSIQGEPRLSHDIDVVINGDRRIKDIIRDNFDKKDFYFDEMTIQEAIASESMFNVIDTESGDKIDFWFLTDSPFDASRFERKLPVKLFDETAWISTPEDTILAKMLWAEKSGGSLKQLADIRQVFAVNAAVLDRGYVTRWSAVLGVKKYWDDLLRSQV
jgi:hypothetical protein